MLSEQHNLRVLTTELVARGLPSATDDSDVPTLIHDGKTIRCVNGAFSRWLGRERDKIVGQALTTLADAADQSSLLTALAAGGSEPQVEAHVQRFARSDGTPLIGRVLARRVAFADRLSTLVVIEPYSEGGRSPELLKVLQEAVDHLNDIVFITEGESIDGVGRRVVFVNRAFSRVTGFKPEDVLGKTPNITVGDETDRAALARIEDGLKARRPVHEELLKYAKDGSEYWVELEIVPIFDGVRLAYWVSIQRDITERKRLQARLLQTAQVASAGQLAAQLASELNNPLAAVSSCLEWLSDQLPAVLAKARATDDQVDARMDEILEAFSDARAGTARLAAATNYLRILGGTAPAPRRDLDLKDTLEAALTEVLHDAHLFGQVEREYGQVPKISAEPNRLRHALRLLLKNAVQALPPSNSDTNKLILRLELRDEAVLVAIEDTGTGIPSEVRSRLFAPFVTTRPRGVGSGLGLFIAHRLVRELDGSIELRQRAGGGTIAEVLVPYGELVSP